MKTDEMIFSHEPYCVGGITINGVIGVRDYQLPFDIARDLYIREVKHIQINHGISNHELKNGTAHRLGATYRGLDTFNNILLSYWRKGITCPAMKYLILP